MTFNIVKEVLRNSVLEDLFSSAFAFPSINYQQPQLREGVIDCFSAQQPSSVQDVENRVGANSPPISLPSSNENLTIHSSSFVSAPHHDNNPLSRSLGGLEAANLFRRSLSNNNASGLLL